MFPVKTLFEANNHKHEQNSSVRKKLYAISLIPLMRIPVINIDIVNSNGRQPFKQGKFIAWSQLLRQPSKHAI